MWNLDPKELKAEIGYVLHPDFQGKGIMQEAVVKVIEYGFEKMYLLTIMAVLEPGNARSIILLVKNGFVYDKESDDEVVYTLAKPKMNNNLQL